MTTVGRNEENKSNVQIRTQIPFSLNMCWFENDSKGEVLELKISFNQQT